MVIYVDVLFVVNFFITFLLLIITGKIAKREGKMYRIALASALGGLYSLVILVEELNFLVTFSGKILMAFLIVLTAFGLKQLYVYIKTTLIFFFSNMLFLGVIVAIILTFSPNGIVVNNSTVYFDISVKLLLVCALLAYVISNAVIWIYNRSAGKKEIYHLTIIKNEKQVKLYAFLDTGNKLKEPFSNYPVIIADKSKLDFEAERIIPFDTVGGEGALKAFKPDKIILSCCGKTLETNRVYIAVSDVKSKEFSAILNPEVLNAEIINI